MILFIFSVSLISSFGLLGVYMYNSYKDMDVKNDINEYLLSTIYEEYDDDYDFD